MEHGSINYTEFPARDIEATQTFLFKRLLGVLKTTGLSILLSKVKV